MNPLDINMKNKRQPVPEERGQSIVLLALLLVILLAFAGLAVDVGFAFVRSSQFSAAVDAAALAGVVDLDPTKNDTEAADQRAAQFLATNGWPTDTLSIYPFPSSRSLTRGGIPQYTITVTWPVETFFIGLLGIESFAVTHSATAAFYAQSEIYTTTAYDHSRLRRAAQFIFGPDACTREGDPVSPRWSAEPGSPNQEYHLYGGIYRYRIQVSSAYTQSNILRVELFDPDSYNYYGVGSNDGINETYNLTATHSLNVGGGPLEEKSCGSAGAGEKCIFETGESLVAVNQNPFWLWRVDEAWDNSCEAQTGNASGDVVTRYELYYLDEATGERETLAQYTVDNERDYLLTDLQWASPGTGSTGSEVPADFGSFEIVLADVPADARGNRFIHLDVQALSGSGKNVWDLWAGPPASYYTSRGLAPPARNANERNLQFANSPAIYLKSDRGVSIFALGRMPVQHFVSGSKIPFPLSPLDTRQGGGNIYATMFDFDTDEPPLPSDSDQAFFSIDTVSPTDFKMHVEVVEEVDPDNCDPDHPDGLCGTTGNPLQTSCDGGLDCDNLWMNPQFGMGIPDSFFFGGTLFLNYDPGGDAHTWAVSISAGRPFLTR
jgi:hypothetical protein